MSILRFIFCIRDEHETLVATLDMWKFRVVTIVVRSKQLVPELGEILHDQRRWKVQRLELRSLMQFRFLEDADLRLFIPERSL